MDQDSFRQLMQTPRAGSSLVLGGASRLRGSLLSGPPKKKSVDSSKPAFKPRTVKKTQDSKYRDRASERRTGDGNDYAQVEAVLEQFEKKNADVKDKEKVEAQRKYLGGDSEHSVLVKGLDFALLEQNKSRSVLTEDDVDALDRVFLESSSDRSSVPKKRTREDLIRELKEKREGVQSNQAARASPNTEVEARRLEEAKQKGKFKPIGFKPLGSASEKKKLKAVTAEEDKKKKKKKRKLDGDDKSEDAQDAIISSGSMPPPPAPTTSAIQASKEPEDPIDDDFDIFADAGDYEGIADDDDEPNLLASAEDVGLEDGEEVPPLNTSVRRIFDDLDEPDFVQPTSQAISLPSIPSTKPNDQSSSRSGRHVTSDDEEVDDDQPMRLVPLSSSAVPSIKELLAMDKAASSHGKNKKRKLKKAGESDTGDGEAKKKPSLEQKVDRDYKRLKTYTDKKAAAEER